MIATFFADQFCALIISLSATDTRTLDGWTEGGVMFGWQDKVAAVVALNQMSDGRRPGRGYTPDQAQSQTDTNCTLLSHSGVTI